MTDNGKNPASGEDPRLTMLHEMQRHSPEGVEADKATVRRELRLLVPLTIVGLIGTGIALHCFGGWLAVGLGVVVFAGYYAYGWGPGLLAAWIRHKERARMLREIDAERTDAPK